MTFSLEDYIDGTAANARRSLATYPDHVAVIRQIDEAFAVLLDHVTGRNDHATVFAAMSHADFLAATRLALGGELPASLAAARSCVEDALYGFFIHRHPELMKVWASRHESDEAKSAVRKNFKYAPMLEDLRKYLQKVGDQVDVAYQATIDLGAHPNVLKLFMNLKADPSGGYEWQYVNLDKLDVGMALRGVAFAALAALNTFKEVWPITFGSTAAGRTLQDIHAAFVALPDISDEEPRS
ncbi:MAG: hypothetical protein WA208_18700 [Thermoanaerobaculia bacterium]